MSHGPRCDGSALLKSFSESAQNRTSGMPGIAAIASSAAVNGVRGGNFGGAGTAGGGASLPGVLPGTLPGAVPGARAFGPLGGFCAASCETGTVETAAAMTIAAQPQIARRQACLVVKRLVSAFILI